MKVTIGQINTTNGNIEGNVFKILSAIEKAKQDGSDLVVLPELAIHGYTSQDWFQDHDIIHDCLLPLDKIIPSTGGITAILGTIRPNNENDGRRLFNSAAVVSNRKLLGFADKTLLPEYDIFDDPRYFEPGKQRQLFEVNGVKIGVAICEDFWNDKTFSEDGLYENDPTDELIALGAGLIVSINASPFNKGKIKLRRDMVVHRAKKRKIPVAFTNLVGGNDGIIFDGASLVANKKGEIIFQADDFEESIETVDLDAHMPDSNRIISDEIETVRRALILGVRDYARKNGFKKAVLGLSGGIDSTLVTVLACEALGAENVLCMMMPSPFSSKESVSHSKKLVANLGCESRIEPISDVFEDLLEKLKFQKPKKGGENLAVENMQSRLRGVILMAISNAQHRLLLSTGNKSELAVGYCTLYGDTNGGLSVIGDVLKTEVYAISRHINKSFGRELIPIEIIEKAPSAELAPNQFDVDSLPPYELIDPILKLYFENKLSPKEIIAKGNNEELVFGLLNKVESPANEFKRRQLPPTLIVSKNAIGIGRRRPVTHKYQRVKTQPWQTSTH